REAFLRERLRQRTVNEAHTFLDVAFVRDRALEVVEHRHELLDQPLVGARGQLLLVARNPLAVVVELGLQPLQRVEILVALLRGVGERVHDLLDVVKRLVGHYSSTTSYSASSTTSSSEGASPPLPLGCCCADACA